MKMKRAQLKCDSACVCVSGAEMLLARSGGAAFVVGFEHFFEKCFSEFNEMERESRSICSSCRARSQMLLPA
jgi:hypothetical protein